MAMPIGTYRTLAVIWRLALGLFLVAAVDGGMDAARYINLENDPSTPWFPCVYALGSMVAWYCGARQARRQRLRSLVPYLSLSVLIGVGLALISLTTNGAFRGERILLYRDSENAPPLFALATVLSRMASAGIVEESGVRGIVQLGLRKHVSPLWAELLAGVEFVLLHGTKLARPAELLLVSLTAVCAGRLTSVTQSTGCAVLLHCICNLTITFGLLALGS
jgi:membrane protease YdiL (CAAX protease family)